MALFGLGDPGSMANTAIYSAGQSAMISYPSMRDRLNNSLTRNKDQQAKIERMIAILEKNPDIEELINLSNEVSY